MEERVTGEWMRNLWQVTCLETKVPKSPGPLPYVPRYMVPRGIVNQRLSPPNQAIEKCRLPYIWTADNRHLR